MTKKILDCIIIGGGIAGLTAGIYLARFGCHIKIIDNDDSRALTIPLSHNYPAFPKGIAGRKIIQRMRQQFLRYGPIIELDTVTTVTRHPKKEWFLIKTSRQLFQAHYIILATGVIDIEPALPNVALGIKHGFIRHCLICDAYEARHKKIAVIGQGKKGYKTACMLLPYSKDITYFDLDNKSIQRPSSKYIRLIKRPIKCVKFKKNKAIIVQIEDKALKFDVMYSALGTEVRSQLAISLGAKHNKQKCVATNSKQESSIAGLYAVGDVSTGINQMCVASSQAVVASLAIFRKLSDKEL